MIVRLTKGMLCVVRKREWVEEEGKREQRDADGVAYFRR